MRRIFKNLPLLFCLLAPCVLSADEAAVVIKPWTISFNYLDLDDNNLMKITQGMEVAFKLEAMDGYGVKESIRMWPIHSRPEDKTSLYLRDLKGNDLGKSTYAGYKHVTYGEDEEAKDILYYLFNFSCLPPIGSEGLEFLDEVPLHVLSCQTISPPQLLQIKEGSQLFLDDLTLTVGVMKEEGEEQEEQRFEVDFKFDSPNKAMEIIDTVFYYQDGQPLLDDKGNLGYRSTGIGSSFNANRTYAYQDVRFKLKPDLLKVSVNYWAKVEVVEQPLPSKILFYDPEAEEADNTSK